MHYLWRNKRLDLLHEFEQHKSGIENIYDNSNSINALNRNRILLQAWHCELAIQSKCIRVIISLTYYPKYKSYIIIQTE